MQRSRILVVEDNDLNMKLIRAVLTYGGYEILEARDGEAALRVASGERPDLVLMDVQLPRMSGLEVTRRLRAETSTSSVPVIAMTAYALRGDKEKIIEAGCDGYVSKPIDTRALPGVIAEYLDRAGAGGAASDEGAPADETRRRPKTIDGEGS